MFHRASMSVTATRSPSSTSAPPCGEVGSAAGPGPSSRPAGRSRCRPAAGHGSRTPAVTGCRRRALTGSAASRSGSMFMTATRGREPRRPPALPAGPDARPASPGRTAARSCRRENRDHPAVLAALAGDRAAAPAAGAGPDLHLGCRCRRRWPARAGRPGRGAPGRRPARHGRPPSAEAPSRPARRPEHDAAVAGRHVRLAVPVDPVRRAAQDRVLDEPEQVHRHRRPARRLIGSRGHAVTSAPRAASWPGSRRGHRPGGRPRRARSSACWGPGRGRTACTGRWR